MNYEQIPIQNFVAQKYATPTVQKLVDTWRIEPQLVIDRIVEHFREMGIFRVPFNQERLLMANLLHYLKTSPDLTRLVMRARNDEMKRQRNRHAD